MADLLKYVATLEDHFKMISDGYTLRQATPATPDGKAPESSWCEYSPGQWGLCIYGPGDQSKYTSPLPQPYTPTSPTTTPPASTIPSTPIPTTPTAPTPTTPQAPQQPTASGATPAVLTVPITPDGCIPICPPKTPYTPPPQPADPGDDDFFIASGGMKKRLPKPVKSNQLGGKCGFDPGSANMCTDVLSLIDKLAELGGQLMDWFVFAIESIGDQWETWTKNVRDIFGFGPPLADAMAAIPMKWLTHQVKAVYDSFPAIEPGRIAILVALNLLKAALGALRDAKIGWGLGPNGILTVSAEIKQVTQVIDYLCEYVCPMNNPTSSEIVQMQLAKTMEDDHAYCLHRMNGNSEMWTKRLVEASRSRANDSDIMRLKLRGLLEDQEFMMLMRRNGWIDTADIARVFKLTEYHPPPSDMIRFSVKDIFSFFKLGKDEMIAEYKEQESLKELFATHGIGDFEYKGKGGKREKFDVGLAYWMAHYQNLSPTQAFECLHRLRPNRVGKWKFRDKDGKIVSPKPVELADVRLLLKEDDYNPIWRDRLAAISYRMTTRVDIRRFYNTGVYGEPKGRAGFDISDGGIITVQGNAEREVYEAYQDLGYDETDAKRAALFTARTWENSKKKVNDTRSAALWCRKYMTGLITREKAEKEIKEVIQNEEMAKRTIANCDLERTTRDAEQTIRSLRTIFIRGQMSVDGVKQELRKAGMELDRANETLDSWRLVMLGRRREHTASEMCAYVSDGLLTRDEFRVRLKRIGYTDEDATRILKHCDLGILARESKARDRRLAAELREERRREAIRLRMEKERQREEDKVRQAEMSGRTAKRLVDWWKRGLVAEADVQETLEFRGWRNDDIARFIIENRPGEESLLPAPPEPPKKP